MSRYIDADAFERAVMFSDDEDLQDVIYRLRDYPSIDIVRCKECKNNYCKERNHGKMNPKCDFTDRKLTENDYCSRGEREGE